MLQETNHSRRLSALSPGPSLAIAPTSMWNRPAQSPFRRFAAAQIEGGSASQQPDEPSELREAPSEAGIVLVVDDEPAIVESLTKIFRREGLAVLAATDGTAAL